jgi:hypothetical protein
MHPPYSAGSDVLDSNIQYLLVIITSREVQLMGLSLNQSDHLTVGKSQISMSNQLSLYLTRMSVSCDGVIMLCACGLATGQLFLGGRNGYLYEFDYEVSTHDLIQSDILHVLLLFSTLSYWIS